MTLPRTLTLAAGLALATSLPGEASVCDYRLSNLIGGGGAASVAVGGAATAGTGLAMQAAGFYTLVHASSGLTMLGSTLAGGSAAGTIGIIAGTGGFLGTVASILLAPVTIIAGGILAAGVGGLETVCYFADERIVNYGEVLRIVREIARSSNPELFREVPGRAGASAILMWDHDRERHELYQISDLYILNGNLMHRRNWWPDRNLGQVAFVAAAEAEEQAIEVQQ